MEFKLIVYDAVVRSELMYGLESLQLNEDLKERLNIFQRKGLRQILKIKTTYGQMQKNEEKNNSNDFVMKLANAKINTWEARQKGEPEEGDQPKFRNKKEIIWLSEYYEQLRRKFIMEIINASETDPIKKFVSKTKHSN